jgi:threonine aldolase
MDNKDIEIIEKEFMISHIKPIDSSKTRVRFVTSWATKKEEVIKLCQMLKQL